MCGSTLPFLMMHESLNSWAESTLFTCLSFLWVYAAVLDQVGHLLASDKHRYVMLFSYVSLHIYIYIYV